MTLTIGDEIVHAARLSAEELRVELAVALYGQGRLTLAQAADLAEIDRITFQRLLAGRRIPLRYDLDADLKTLHEDEAR